MTGHCWEKQKFADLVNDLGEECDHNEHECDEVEEEIEPVQAKHAPRVQRWVV